MAISSTFGRSFHFSLDVSELFGMPVINSFSSPIRYLLVVAWWWYSLQFEKQIFFNEVLCWIYLMNYRFWRDYASVAALQNLHVLIQFFGMLRFLVRYRLTQIGLLMVVLASLSGCGAVFSNSKGFVHAYLAIPLGMCYVF